MNASPKITVVVPVYNTGKYLSACLDSVLSQSMPDFEIVAVNDASTDDSPRILADYAAKDPRIRIVNHEKNKGLLSVRLSGVRAAAGEYVLFLDSDDCFLPDFLKTLLSIAEKKHADIVHFPLAIRDRNHTLFPKVIRLAEKRSRPFVRELWHEDIFRKSFAESAYSWSAVEKLYRTDICRKAMGNIPDQFCIMGEDFCFYTICSFFAEHYVPMKQKGYVYFMDSGISSFRKTELDRFLNRQSPFQALRNVRDFLLNMNVWVKYHEAFSRQEMSVLKEYVLRWMRNLPDADRMKAFHGMFRGYDAFPLFQAFRSFFSDKDELLLEMLSGEDPDSVGQPIKMEHATMNLSPQNTRISPARWNEWQTMIRENHYDAVILEPDDDPERLFWDILAVRDAGAAAVCRRTQNYLAALNRQGLNAWLMEDRVLRQANAVLAADEESAQWYRRRNCHAGISLDNIRPPQYSRQTSAAMLALGNSEKKNAYFRIDPSEDGETFVPFFRKMDHLFRKLPAGFRKKLFRKLADIYNRMTGN